MAFCNNCGKELTPNDRFCPECGAPQPGEMPAASSAPAAPGAENQTMGYTPSAPGAESPPMGYPPVPPVMGNPPMGYPPMPPPRKKNKVLLWVLIPVAILLLGGLVTAAVFLLNPVKQAAAISSTPSGSSKFSSGKSSSSKANSSKASSSKASSSSSSTSTAPSATATVADSRWDGDVPIDSSSSDCYSIVFQNGKAYFGNTYYSIDAIVSGGLEMTYVLKGDTIVFTNTETRETATCGYSNTAIVDTNGIITAIDNYAFYRTE